MIICMLWLVKQSTLTWLLLSFMFLWLLFKWGWGVSKEVRPGSARTAEISVSREIRNFAKSFPAWPGQPRTTWDAMRGKVDRVRRSSCHFSISYLHSILMNDIRVLSLCSSGRCLMVCGHRVTHSVWHSLDTHKSPPVSPDLSCPPLSHQASHTE